MKTILAILLVITSAASAQRIKLISGNLKELKGQKSFAIDFNYDSMKIGRDGNEQAFLEKKRADWNAREAGKGDKYVEEWTSSRRSLYEPAFKRAFEKASVVSLRDQKAKYTMILKTTMTEGGWNVGVYTHPGEIDAELLIVETANPNHVVAVVSITGAEGQKKNGDDFAAPTRTQEAYVVAGNKLGLFVGQKIN